VTAADRRDVQYIFQDPYSSLHPRRTVRQTLEEALRPRRGFEENRSVEDLVAAVHLPVDRVDEHPASLSGGQRQRVGIARALATRPRVLLADEPVSALDLTVQRRVLDLLGELRRELGSTLLFVTHDLAIAKEIAGRVVVLQDGRVVEDGPTDAVFDDPQHDYTKRLLRAVPGHSSLSLPLAS
jgi:ABC-type glutathione transport system ATPase component